MRLSFLRACWLAAVISACASGSGEETAPPEDDTGGSGGTMTGPACTDDASCTLLADSCNRGVCVEGVCQLESLDEGSDCDDRDPCTSTSVCISGNCQGVADIDCSSLSDACGTGVCNPVQGCIKEPHTGDSCDDGLFCTINDACDANGECVGADPYVCGDPTQGCANNVCDESVDACVEEAITMCMHDDACCVAGCSTQDDKECFCINRARFPVAIATSSGGGTGVEDATQMNNGTTEPDCDHHWIDNTSTVSGRWIEYEWPSLVTIGSTYIATSNATNPMCGMATGRNLFSGVVQWWNGTQFVTAANFDSELDDVVIDFAQPIDTTRLRIYDIQSSAGGFDSVIFEWYVYSAAGCRP